MHISHLSLTNFRNYSRLELDLPPHLAVFQGDNAQGKSNLLEAIYILATSRSPRATAEREFINWLAFKDELQVCRIWAEVQRAGGCLRLEIALRSTAGTSDQIEAPFSSGQSATKAAHVQKRIRVNGVVRRAIDLVGQVNVVMFSAQDIDLISGEPLLRRRYLDITNSQVDHHYLRQLQRYNKILWQRNHLLRLIAANQAKPDELSFWDREMVETGSYLIVEREHTVAILDHLAQIIHDELSGGKEELRLVYRRSIDNVSGGEDSQVEEIAAAFAQALRGAREKEIAQGMSLTGPHRDDVRFLGNGVDMGVYGSRGQQRTVALSLKLAEARFLLDKTKEAPVLLLDDVLSELDAKRRRHLLHSAAGYQQVLITATELDGFEPDFLAQTALFRVTQGHIEPISGQGDG